MSRSWLQWRFGRCWGRWGGGVGGVPSKFGRPSGRLGNLLGLGELDCVQRRFVSYNYN